MKLSKNLTLFEFTHAGSGKKFLNPKQHILTPVQLARAIDLANVCFQPIRNYINSLYASDFNMPEIPLKLISGFRCPALNLQVEGSKNSYHMRAQAIDFRCLVKGKLRNDLIIEAIKVLQIPFTELILEYGTMKNPLWIHLALDENNICHSVKRATFFKNKKVIQHLFIW